MSAKVTLLFGVHAHQPVGNFASVVDDAFQRCYRPFLRALYRYPEFLFSLHFSGWLFDYLAAHYPSDIKLVKQMVQRGQIELFGGGETEPVLAVIPSRDRIAQIHSLSKKLEKKLGFRPMGAWLTERVWDATVVPALHDCGIRYVTVDDYHFLCSGRDAKELNGFFSTEEDGKRLDLFPISEALRYRLPFSPASAAVEYIESLAEVGNDAAAIYFDDIEKFGIWPDTYEWVYEKGWLDEFIKGVLASPLIKIEHFKDYYAQAKTRGVVYLPTTSYIEMNEWTLPAGRADDYAAMIESAKQSGVYEKNKSFLRGGIWKNFLSRYPEANWMHKRMLNLSQRYFNLPKKLQSAAMRIALFESQANDAYWHGLFGGLYLPHLRRAVYRALISLEGMLDEVASRATILRQDIDLDGNEELFIQNGYLQLIISLDGSASVREFDVYFLNHNLADTLARRLEHYHRKINAEGANPAAGEASGILSPHERVDFKHTISRQDLAIDERLMTSFYDLHHTMVATTPMSYVPEPLDSMPHISFEALVGELAVTKKYALTKNSLRVTYQFAAGIPGTPEYFGTEINLAMPSCDGPGGRFIYDKAILGGFGQELQLPACGELILQDDNLGGNLRLTCEPPLSLKARPLHTVSQSEAGFEKIMQALIIELRWPIAAPSTHVAITLEIIKNAG